MNADRIREIQLKTAHPLSTSVQQALMQVWNECAQESQARIAKLESENNDLIVKVQFAESVIRDQDRMRETKGEP